MRLRIIVIAGIDHFLVERKVKPTAHPQAHFINVRTMEIMQSHFPASFEAILQGTSDSSNWRDFVYCYSITDEDPFCRVDQFEQVRCGDLVDPARSILSFLLFFSNNNKKNSASSLWKETHSSVAHLPQNKFENILRKEACSNPSDKATFYIGYEATDLVVNELSSNSDSGGIGGIADIAGIRGIRGKSIHLGITNKATSDSLTLDCDYLIAADGAHSFIRRALGIGWHGEAALQSLVNVHFTCKGLHTSLKPRPAMLYFVFNEKSVAVFVSHDAVADEWVAQIPFFPPFQVLPLVSNYTLSLSLSAICPIYPCPICPILPNKFYTP